MSSSRSSQPGQATRQPNEISKISDERGLLGAAVLLSLVAVCANASALSAAQGPASGAGAARRCAELGELREKWPEPSTRILEAAWLEEGSRVASPMGPPVSLPPHCELTAVMRERIGIDGQHYAIRFRLRLPLQWNGRLYFQGGGGTEGDLGAAVGFISPGTPTAIARGFAVVSQDSGHDNAANSVPDRGGPVAFGFDPQARADYGGASLKPVAQAAKAMIRAYYGRSPERSYFVGCSKGGQEGMAFAQRYPEEFDGIVAAAPGFSLPRAALAEAWDTQAFGSLVAAPGAKRFDPKLLAGSFTDRQLSLVREAVLAACDADDGVRDGITAAVGSCTWPRVEVELERRACTAAGADNCVTAAQVAVLRRVYGGAKDSTGRALYSDWPIDAGVGSGAWRMWKIGRSGGDFPGINVAMGAPSLAALFTTPPTALGEDVHSALEFALRFDFDRDAPKIYATDATFQRSAWTDIAARSPQLERFRAHGGKMIVPHGASDPVFSLNDTLAWYREADQLNTGTAADFVRVFPVPGMAHCMGGPATDRFDAFAALLRWVEHGIAPEQILARAGPESPWPGRTRPLCAYPKIALYRGSGNLEEARNFSCAAVALKR